MVVTRHVKQLHTSISIWHDSAALVAKSVEILGVLGFRLTESFSDSRFQLRRLYLDRMEKGSSGCTIDLIEDAHASTIRRLTWQRPLVAPISVSIYTDGSVPDSLQTIFSRDYRNFQVLTTLAIGRKPSLQVRCVSNRDKIGLENGQKHATSAADEKLGGGALREVILPFTEGAIPSAQTSREDLSNTLLSAGMSETKHVGVFSCAKRNHGTVFRLFPGLSAIGIVLEVEDLSRAHQYLQSTLPMGHVSRLGNGVTDVELQLTGSHLAEALDFRIAEEGYAIRSFHRENLQVLLTEASLDIQNVRVTAGDELGNSTVDSRTLHGDCWSEFKSVGAQRIRNVGGIRPSGSYKLVE